MAQQVLGIPVIDGETIVEEGGVLQVGTLPVGAVTRRWTATFYQNLLTATGIDLTQTIVAPSGPGNESTTWTPVLAYLSCPNPGSGATSAQVVKGASGNAAFGSGTAILASTLSVSGLSMYEASTTTMASGATVTSGTPIAVDWVALGGSDTVVQIEFQGSY